MDGAWSLLLWPDQWANSGILKDITFLEMVPIALEVMLWKRHFRGLPIQFCTDNMACLHILNSKSGKSERVIKLVRAIVLWSLQFDFHINAVHVKSADNFTDSISRKQWAKFKFLQPHADSEHLPSWPNIAKVNKCLFNINSNLVCIVAANVVIIIYNTTEKHTVHQSHNCQLHN